MRSPLPAKVEPQHFTAIIDSREQHALDLSPLRTEVACLQTADYSVKHLEDQIAIERKSLEDLLGCCGRERERFEKEIQRLLAYPVRALVVEASWTDVAAGQWRSKITPKVAESSLLGWVARGLPVVLSGDHKTAGRHVARILFISARRRYLEARVLAAGIAQDENETVERSHSNSKG